MMNDVAAAKELERLSAIEEIKQAKARYFRGVDTSDGALVRGVLADDCVLDYMGCCTDPKTGQDFLPSMNVVMRLSGARLLPRDLREGRRPLEDQDPAHPAHPGGGRLARDRPGPAASAHRLKQLGQGARVGDVARGLMAADAGAVHDPPGVGVGDDPVHQALVVPDDQVADLPVVAIDEVRLRRPLLQQRTAHLGADNPKVTRQLFLAMRSAAASPRAVLQIEEFVREEVAALAADGRWPVTRLYDIGDP
jgi:hypothetical protein